MNESEPYEPWGPGTLYEPFAEQFSPKRRNLLNSGKSSLVFDALGNQTRGG